MKTQLSITTDFDDDGGPIEPKLARFAAAGFTHVHWCEHWSRDFLYEDFYAEGVERALRRNGLRLLDVHNAQTASASPSSADPLCRSRGVRLLRNRLEFTARLGGDAVVVHPGPFDVSSPTFAAQWSALEASIVEVAPLCENLRVRVALENMAKLPPPPEFFRLADKFPSSVFGFCLDTGHANIPTADPELARKMGERLFALHLHDNHGEKDEHALPGRGTIPWDKVLSAIRSTGYAKPLNFEISLKSANMSADDFLKEARQTGESFAKQGEGKQ